MKVIEIQYVGAQGDGVAEGPVYAPLTLPGEKAQVRLKGQRAEVEAILEPSVDRIEPVCPHFGACGGCAFQHWADEPYLAWKVEQVRSVLAREGLETEITGPFPARPATRRRLALHARRDKGGVRLGFKGRRSWDVVDLQVCTIAHPKLVEALPQLRALADPFLEHPKSAPSLHVTLTDTGLDIDVTGVERRSGGLSADARMRAAEAAQAADFARVTMAGEIVYQERLPVVRFGRATVGLPPGAFLQATADAEAEMTRLVCEAAAGATRIADLYCGSGTFTFPLAEIAPVHGADFAEGAIAGLRTAIATAPGLKAITAEARDLVRRPVLSTELNKMDVVVFDPPRAGAAEQTAQIAASKVGRVIGVSCNPTTFARDARTLADAGFRLTRVNPVDQFLWSPHIELVGVFER